jgi:hypothetical protein
MAVPWDGESVPAEFQANHNFASACSFPSADVNSFAGPGEENAKLLPPVFGKMAIKPKKGREGNECRSIWGD